MKIIERIAGREIFIMCAAIFILIVFQIFIAMNYRINLDEFFFLSQIHDAERGLLNHSLQTIHVHIFSWLREFPDDEIKQIIAGRSVMLFAEVLTVGFIIFSANKFVPFGFAVFAGLAWLTTGYTITEGFSFRTDPLATTLLMAAVALSLSGSLDLRKAALAGFLVGIAGLVTIKSVLYAPAFVAAILWQAKERDWRALLQPICIALLAMTITFLVLYLLHSASLPQKERGSTEIALNALYTTLLGSRLFPELNGLLGWLVLSMVPVYLMFLSLRGNLIAFLFFAPLLSVLIYRNSFPYFFPFISAPTMIAVAIGAAKMRSSRWLMIVFALLMLASTSLQVTYGVLAHQKFQKSLVSAVHQIFPQPVPYIDQVAMISTFPKYGFFMTTWGMQNYQQNGVPIMDRILESNAPPLLVANHQVLLYAMGVGDHEQDRVYLFPEDNETLRKAFVKYWGPVYVAGIEFDAGPEPVMIEIKISGEYRNDSDASFKINGIEYHPGETLNLPRGSYQLGSMKKSHFRLIWAAAKAAPDTPAPDVPVI